MDDLQNGQYLIRFTQAAAGECKIMVRLDNVDVPPLVLQFKGEKGPEKGETGGGKDGGRGIWSITRFGLIQGSAGLQYA